MTKKTPKVQYGGSNTSISSNTGLDFCIIKEGKQVGRFWFDEDSKAIKFEGDADESAKIFIESSTRILQTWVDIKNDERNLLLKKIKLLEVPDYIVDGVWTSEMKDIDAALTKIASDKQGQK